MKTTHTFTKKEVMVPFKCDVHGWMNAYVGVLDHPYFAMTGTDGKFELKSLPPGTYTIEAWHEKLGAADPERDARREGNKEVTFTLQGAGDGNRTKPDRRGGQARQDWQENDRSAPAHPPFPAHLP